MFSTAGLLIRTKASLQGSEAEQKLSTLLCDDAIQVISSFELNQVASLTYHENSIATNINLNDQIFELLHEILSKPASYTPLTIQKALVVTKHVLIFGAEKVITAANCLTRAVHDLQQYNTVLLAAQQSGATGFLYRLKGGGVDRGGPVREMAVAVLPLLTDRKRLEFERTTQADPNSLVPIGNDQVAFATDEMRLFALKKRIEEQERIEIRSNLAKADNGFGGGYNSRDGKAVVGAAHSIEEMIAMAQRKAAKEKSRYTDDGTNRVAKARGTDDLNFSDYCAPDLMGASFGINEPPAPAQAADLLSLETPEESYSKPIESSGVDLLDLSAPPVVESESAFNLMGSSAPSSDPFSEVYTAPETPTYTMTYSTGMMDILELNNASAPTTMKATNIFSPRKSVDMTPTPIVMSASTSLQQQQQQQEEEDRFAALDALVEHSQPKPPTPSANSNAFSSLQDADLSNLVMNQLHINASSIQVSGQLVPQVNNDDDDDDENGFVMGGGAGMGIALDGPPPYAPAPAAPPPPPPASTTQYQETPSWW